MSRAERRQYQRMMKGADPTGLPPAARARADRIRARREAIRATRTYAFSPRFWLVSLAIAAIVGLLGLSLQWSAGMPFALYVGLGVGAAALALQVILRIYQRRRAAR